MGHKNRQHTHWIYIHKWNKLARNKREKTRTYLLMLRSFSQYVFHSMLATATVSIGTCTRAVSFVPCASFSVSFECHKCKFNVEYRFEWNILGRSSMVLNTLFTFQIDRIHSYLRRQHNKLLGECFKSAVFWIRKPSRHHIQPFGIPKQWRKCEFKRI